jgi:transcriptional regulator with XRE-family HTH domain
VSAVEIGRRVRAARAYAALSTADLATRARLSSQVVGQIERGARNATAAELDAFAESCGVPRDFFSHVAGPVTASRPAEPSDLAARLRQLRRKLDDLLNSNATTRVPIRADASLLDALDPSFDGVDPRLIRAIENPLRQRLLGLCMPRSRTAEDLSAECGAPLADVVEQLDALVSAGAVDRIVRDGQATYQAIVWDIFNDRQWAYFPSSFRRAQFAYVLNLIQDDVRAAMRSGGFDGETVHVSRSTLRLDARGYEELIAMLSDALLRTLQINAESDARRTYGDSEEEIETELAILHFHGQPGGRAGTTVAERS